MVDALEGAGLRARKRAKSLSETARQATLHAITKTTVIAAQRALRIVGDTAAQPQQIARRMRDLRTDSALQKAMDHDVRLADAQAHMLMQDALWLGFVDGAHARADAISGDGLNITVEPDASDRRALIGYPIVGHSSDEAAGHLSMRLRYDAESALTCPLTMGIDPGKVIADLGQAGADHAARVAGAVSTAYYAGIQAATKAIAAALMGVA